MYGKYAPTTARIKILKLSPSYYVGENENIIFVLVIKIRNSVSILAIDAFVASLTNNISYKQRMYFKSNVYGN